MAELGSAGELGRAGGARSTCAGCGILCDDVTVEPAGDGVRLAPPCSLGAAWLSARAQRPAGEPAATIGGRPADLETALGRAGALLRAARRPLLHGFDAATVEDARAAVALADRLGALIATDPVSDPWPGAPAIPLRGASTATLGEIRDRSSVVVIWREDPETTHPRLLDRLGFGFGAGAGARAARTLVVVDDRDTATTARADRRLRFPAEHDLQALSRLHALARGAAPPPGELGPELAQLLEQLTAVPHATVVHGPGLTAGEGGQRRALALHELVRALCDERHVVTLALGAAAGIRGAQDVLAWQTGYPDGVDLASGHPELITATRPLTADEDIDVALSIEGASVALGAGVTRIALTSLPVADAEVSIHTAAAGVQRTGTVHRLDGVPLALQAPLPDDAPTAAALLDRLLTEVTR